MSQWAEVRHLHLVEGVPKKEIARRLKLDVKTVRRAVGRQTPPVRVSPPRPSSLEPWREQIRRRFATDPLNLTLAGPRVNRYEKVDHDAAEWLPAQNRCWFAARVVAVRQRYGLTIDQREAAALDQVLAGCASTELITFARGRVPATATPSDPEDRGAAGDLPAVVRSALSRRCSRGRAVVVTGTATRCALKLMMRGVPPPRTP